MPPARTAVRRVPVRPRNDARVGPSCVDFGRPELDISTGARATLCRHPHAGGDPSESPQAPSLRWFAWVPAFAGMTEWGTMAHKESQRRIKPDSSGRRSGPICAPSSRAFAAMRTGSGRRRNDAVGNEGARQTAAPNFPGEQCTRSTAGPVTSRRPAPHSRCARPRRISPCTSSRHRHRA